MDASARLRDDLVRLDSFRARLARGDHSAGSVSLSTALSKAAESVLGLTTKGLSSGLQIRRCRRLKRSEHARAWTLASRPYGAAISSGVLRFGEPPSTTAPRSSSNFTASVDAPVAA